VKKEIAVKDAMNSRNWQKASTENWRQSDGRIEVEFEIAGIPGATAFQEVVSNQRSKFSLYL